MRRRQRKRTNLAFIVVGSLVALFGGLVLFSALAVHSVAEDLNLKEGDLKEIRLGQNTRIYDKNGKLLGIVAGVTNRTVVPSRRIPKVLKDATVAIEDKRFYDHSGVDYYRLLGGRRGATWRADRRPGGSTITMQLIKNLYEPQADRTLSKKIEEAYLAYQYEERYTKDEILAKYLNGVFYGQNAVGVQAASLTYFDKDVSEINLQQAALLAGLPQAPTTYNPFANPEAAKARRNLVIDEMADQGHISQELAEKAKRSGLALKRGNAYKVKREEYFTEYVRQVLIDRYGEKRVQTGGYKVYTTIDPALQSAARRAIRENLYYEDDPASAVVMVDSQKGYIRAMASSVTVLPGEPVQLRHPGRAAARVDVQDVRADHGGPRGDQPVHDALHVEEARLRRPAVRAHRRRDVLQQLPRRDPDRHGDALLGQLRLPAAHPRRRAEEGDPDGLRHGRVEGTQAARRRVDRPRCRRGHAARHGHRLRAALERRLPGTPIAIAKIVKPDGSVDVFKPERKKVFKDGVSYEVTRILQNNVTGGTGGNAQIGYPVAGKTGTTDDFRDAWFVGYTPKYSTARLGRLPQRGRRHAVHDQRPRHRGGRRHVPGPHLGRLHAGGRRARRRLRLLRSARRAHDLVAVHERFHPVGRGRGGERGERRVVGGIDGGDRVRGDHDVPAAAAEQWRPVRTAAAGHDGRAGVALAAGHHGDPAGAGHAAARAPHHAHPAAPHHPVGSQATEGGTPRDDDAGGAGGADLGPADGDRRSDAARGGGRGRARTAVLLLFGPPGGDQAAHLYLTQAWRDNGWQLWDNFWYSGRYAQINYSLLFYPFAAVAGTTFAVSASCAGAAAAFAALLRRRWPGIATGPAVAFAVLVPLGAVAGTYPFLLGLALALGTLLALDLGFRALALLGILLTALAHPLALAFLLIVLAAVGATTRGWWRRPGNLAIVVGGALVAGIQALLLRGFPADGAHYPFDPKDALAIAGFCAAGLLLTGASRTSVPCGRCSWATRRSARRPSRCPPRSAATPCA